MLGWLLIVGIMVLLVQNMLWFVLRGVWEWIVSVGTLLNHEVSVWTLNNFLPLGPNFLILNLRCTSLDSLHQVVFLLTVRYLESLLNYKVAVIMAYESEKSRRLADLFDKNWANVSVSWFKTFLYDTWRILLNTQLWNLICQLMENGLAHFWLPFLNYCTHSVVSIRVRHELDEITWYLWDYTLLLFVSFS